MTFGEAVRLTRVLAEDPGSQVARALNSWDYAASREFMVLAELRDITLGGLIGEKATPYPRPWPLERSGRLKPKPQLSQDQIRAALRAAGHTAPFPDELEASRG